MLKLNARISLEVDENGKSTGIEKFYMGNEDVPGLDITRSIGDKIGKYIGMIFTPEIKQYVIQPEDKFVIIGTSGLWKYLTPNDAVSIVKHSWEINKVEQSCDDLVNEASRRWKDQEIDKPSQKTDHGPGEWKRELDTFRSEYFKRGGSLSKHDRRLRNG